MIYNYSMKYQNNIEEEIDMRKYTTPVAEKLTFDYQETVAASGNGHKYRLYTDTYYGCNTTETDIWVDEPPTP